MERCLVCNEEFKHLDDLYVHFRHKRKNKPHAEHINALAKKSFFADDPVEYMRSNQIDITRSALNDKWKLWFSQEERKSHGRRLISQKNSNRVYTEEAKQRVSDGLRKAYASGTIPGMKGKTPHNKGVKCSDEQKRRISETLRRRYATGEIEIVNNGNNFKYGVRKDIGHFCRSSWEANFCRFLKWLGVEYIYEPKTFTLNSPIGLLAYKPDIFLPQYNLFIEIKGRYSEISRLKHTLFKEQYKDTRLVVIPREKYIFMERRLCRKIPNWELSKQNDYLTRHLIKGEL